MSRKRSAKAKAEPEPEPEQVDPTKLKVNELKEELKKRGLDTSGKKAELVERLKEALEEGEPSAKKTKDELVSTFKAEAVKSSASGRRTHKVDKEAPGASSCSVVEDYDCMLNQTNIGHNNNKFYVIQVLLRGKQYVLWNRWGRVGETGQSSLKAASDLEAAVKDFKKKFQDKTKNKWDDRDNFKPSPGKYTLIEMAEEDGDEEEAPVVVKKEGPAPKVKACSLDAPTQKLLKLIFDTDMFNDTLKKYNIDTKKMPLGKLSKVQIAKGFEVLEEIEAELDKPSHNSSHLNALSSRFYTVVPHNFGRNIPPTIKTKEALQEKYDMLMVLGDIAMAQNMQKAQDSVKQEVKEVPHPLDVNYGTLNTSLEYVQKTDPEHSVLLDYILNTGGKNARDDLLGVWRVDRQGEGERFDAHKSIDNRKLLWHGTNVAVVAAIMKTGLRIMPHSGGRVGRGIYFASEHSKSSGYVWPAKNVGIMFLNEVALGREKHITRDDHTLVKAPAGYDSVVARGHREPDPSVDDFLELDGRKVTVPKGAPVPLTPFKGSSFFQSEYLVYQESQARIRYMLTFKR